MNIAETNKRLRERHRERVSGPPPPPTVEEEIAERLERYRATCAESRNRPRAVLLALAAALGLPLGPIDGAGMTSAITRAVELRRAFEEDDPRPYNGELRAFFESVRGAVGAIGDDCGSVREKIAELERDRLDMGNELRGALGHSTMSGAPWSVLLDDVRRLATGAEVVVRADDPDSFDRTEGQDEPADTFIGWTKMGHAVFDDGVAFYGFGEWSWHGDGWTIGSSNRARSEHVRVSDAFDVVPERHHPGLCRALDGLPGLPVVERWEYARTIHPVRFTGHPAPPEGDGWERDRERGHDGRGRFDDRAEVYWRRRYPLPADESAAPEDHWRPA